MDELRSPAGTTGTAITFGDGTFAVAASNWGDASDRVQCKTPHFDYWQNHGQVADYRHNDLTALDALLRDCLEDNFREDYGAEDWEAEMEEAIEKIMAKGTVGINSGEDEEEDEDEQDE